MPGICNTIQKISENIGQGGALRDNPLPERLPTSNKIPAEMNPVWRRIVSGKALYKFEFVATKILLGRLTVMVQHSPEQEILLKGATELRNIFVKNIKLPSVQRDLQKIIGGC